MNMNIPDYILNDPERLDEFLKYLRRRLANNNVDIIEEYIRNRSTTSQNTTTNEETNNVFGSSHGSVSGMNNQNTSELLRGASMRDIKILMAFIMNMDLDKDGYPDLFALIKNMKTSLMNSSEYDNEGHMQRDLYSYRNQYPSQGFMEKLYKRDREMFRRIFGDKKAYEYSTTFIPGFQYTPPKLWPQQSYRPPVCIADKQKVGNPAFVFGSGTPANALDYESLKMLPEFRYFESQNSEDDRYFAEQRRVAEMCSMRCRDNCDLPICSALDCPSCKQ
jgi:hypothetical protein